MIEIEENELSDIACTLTSLTAILNAYCLCHCENSKEISKLVEFAEILDSKANQLFDFM